MSEQELIVELQQSLSATQLPEVAQAFFQVFSSRLTDNTSERDTYAQLA